MSHLVADRHNQRIGPDVAFQCILGLGEQDAALKKGAC
jgi:hypothetical protein